MSTSIILPISRVIDRLPESPTTFEQLKNQLKSTDADGKLRHALAIKELNDLAIIYHDDVSNYHPLDQECFEWERNTRSVVWDKERMLPIASQHSRVVYNDEAIELLSKADWSKVTVSPCYEGTTVLVFNHGGKWYVTTRRCLDANESTWIKSKSYRQMFDESIDGKFTLDDLNPDNCYFFVLLHHLNRNIVTYQHLPKLYKEVVHLMTVKKYTMDEVDYAVNDKVSVSPTLSVSNLDELLDMLDKLSNQDELNRRVSSEGFIVRLYDGEVGKSTYTVLKLQSGIYQMLLKMKPNNSNIHQSYLELYQNDKLRDFLVYFQGNKIEIIKRINLAMRHMATEILNLYHGTRKQKNPEVYKALLDNYKKVLYELHGLYIENKKNMIDNNQGTFNKDIEKNCSITVHDVYHYLKGMPADKLRQLFIERWTMIAHSHGDQFFDEDNMHIKIQTLLMFRHLINSPVPPKPEPVAASAAN